MQRENESWSACNQPIREENGFDKKKGTYADSLNFFGKNTANSNHLSPPE